jgi:hypothetical protein
MAKEEKTTSIKITSNDHNGRTTVGVNGQHKTLRHNQVQEATDAELEVLTNSGVSYEVVGTNGAAAPEAEAASVGGKASASKAKAKPQRGKVAKGATPPPTDPPTSASQRADAGTEGAIAMTTPAPGGEQPV